MTSGRSSVPPPVAGPCSWTLDHCAAPVRMARAVTEQTLGRWRLVGTCEAAVLVVDELVTNAVRHGASPVELALSVVGEPARGGVFLQIDVHDGSTRRPVPRQGDESGGFGLAIAMALADLSVHPDHDPDPRHGHGHGRGGKVVRACMPLHAPGTGRPSSSSSPASAPWDRQL